MNPFQKAARTFLQTFLSTLLVSLPVGVGAGLPSATVLYAVLAGAAFAGLVSVLTWLMNELEDRGAIPTTLGKTPRREGHS